MSRFPLANVHPDAKIGNNVTIEPFATVQADVTIDDGCWIGPNAILWDGTRLGKNVKIYPGASVSSIPQDLKFSGEKTETFIGDNTVVREYVTISRGTTDKFKTDQRVGFFNLHLNHIQVSYFNDGGTPFDETKLGDSKDRYYTGGAVFSYHGKPYTALNLVELSFYKFTGYTKNAFEVSNKLDLAYVNYNRKEEKYYNKSLWTLNISNPNQG